MAEFALPTERLILRGWRRTDVAPFHAMCRDPLVMEHLGPLMTRERAQEIADRQADFQASHGCCFWVIERRADGAMLGFCGLKPGPDETGLTPLHMTGHQWLVLIVGFVVSYIVALGVVAWFMHWVRKHGFVPFAIYRIIAGIIVLVFLKNA